MTNNPAILTEIAAQLPLQQIFNWLAGVGLPALLGLLLRNVKNSARTLKILSAVIQGVETASKQLGPDARTVKSEIRAAALNADVQPHLDRIVQNVTVQAENQNQQNLNLK